jgi:TP901 family phage tail tape measure protein
MDDKRINVAVVLSAYDRISAVVTQVVASTSAKLNQLQKYSDKIAQASISRGRSDMVTGAMIAAPLIAAAKAYGDQEEAALAMRTAMMQDGGKVNEIAYRQLISFANKTSETLTGSTADYLRMVKVLQENSIKPDEILGGIGDAVSRLSVFFKMAPDSIGQFAARMKQDMGVAPKEMTAMMDVIARLKNAGVGKDGQEAVMEMGEAFSKAGLGAHNLGVSGLQASKDLSALMGIFIRRGISGGTVGNNFRRIFDGLRDADKLKKSNEVARQFGITLDFYNKDHKFKGIAAFAGELSKLKGLNTTQISEVLKPFSGKQGLSTDFLEFLGKEGTSSFNEMQSKLAGQATLNAKVRVMMSGLSNSFERTKTTALNSAAAFASTYAPQLKALLTNFNKLFIRVTAFINTHKTLVGNIARGIAYFAAYKISTGLVLFVVGHLFKEISNGIKVIRFLGVAMQFGVKGVVGLGRGFLYVGAYLKPVFIQLLTRGIPAMASFTATVWANAAAWLANPVTWIILAIIAAIAALVAAGIWMYNHWDKILKWLKIGWALLKGSVVGLIAVFNLFLDVIVGVGKALIGAFTFNPKMIIEGAKQAASAVSKIANGGISTTFNQAAIASYKDTMGIKDKQANSTIKPKVAANTTTHYHFAPVIQAHPGATAKDGHVMADTLKPHFDKWIKDHDDRKKRISYN